MQHPVGDKVAELKPAIWNAKWQGGEGEIVRTKIKDAKLGIIEMSTSRPCPMLGSTRVEILVRNLGMLVIANEKTDYGQKSGYEFGRVAVDDKHLVVFDANEGVFVRLIRRHEIAGEFGAYKNGKPTGACYLKRFSDKDYLRLKREGVDVRSLFDEDPDEVLVRYSWRLF